MPSVQSCYSMRSKHPNMFACHRVIENRCHTTGRSLSERCLRSAGHRIPLSVRPWRSSRRGWQQSGVMSMSKGGN
eukprot:717173-Pelagomonas_calceolata.AAC.1